MTEDTTSAAPHLYTVLFESEHVRILEVNIPPGERSELHIHPAFGFYRLAGGKLIRCATRTGHEENPGPAIGHSKQMGSESVRRRPLVTRAGRRTAHARA